MRKTVTLNAKTAEMAVAVVAADSPGWTVLEVHTLEAPRQGRGGVPGTAAGWIWGLFRVTLSDDPHHD